jgi:hypothetical protein
MEGGGAGVTYTHITLGKWCVQLHALAFFTSEARAPWATAKHDSLDLHFNMISRTEYYKHSASNSIAFFEQLTAFQRVKKFQDPSLRRTQIFKPLTEARQGTISLASWIQYTLIQPTSTTRTYVLILLSCVQLSLITFSYVIKVPWTSSVWSRVGRGMANAASRRPLTAKVQVRTGSIHIGFVVDKVALGQVFRRVLRFFLSILFHRGSSYLYITTCWMSNGPVGGRISETSFHPIDMNNMNNTMRTTCPVHFFSLIRSP